MFKAEIDGIYFEFFGNYKDVLVFLPGFPHSYCDGAFLEWLSNKLSLSIVYPRYPGSWESYGYFFDESRFVRFLTSFGEEVKEVYDLYSGDKVNIYRFKYAIGHSFGGFLSIKYANMFDKVLAVSPALNVSESFMERHVKWVKRFYGNSYRFGKISPLKWNKEIPENVMVFHSKDDDVVKVEDNKRFYKGLIGKRVFLYNGYGHGKKQIIKRHVKKVISWFI